MDERCHTCNKWRKHYFREHCDAKGRKFLKVMEGGFSEGMIIPEEFIKRYKADLAQAIKLKGPAGYTWRVRLRKAAEYIIFGDIWEKFLMKNQVEQGDCLVFEYEGHSCFRVVVFDGNGLEKISPSLIMGNFLHTEFHQEEDSEDKSHEISSLGQSSDSAMEVPLSTSPEKCKHKKKRERACETKQTMFCSKQVKKEVNEVLDDTPLAKEKVMFLSVILSNRRPITDAEAARTLKRAYAMRLANPSFLTVMKPSHVYKRFFMTVPSNFAKKYIPSQRRLIVLRLPKDTREWRVSYADRTLSSAGFTGLTWMQFVYDNNLEEGDACVFEITENSKVLVMDVHIFRVVENVVPFTVERM